MSFEMATEMLNDNHENGTAKEIKETDPLNKKTEKQNGVQKRNLRQNCWYVIKNMTVEPTMFLFAFSSILAILTSQNLNLEKACRVNLNYTKEICDSLKLQTADEQNVYERNVQQLVATAMSWRAIIAAAIPCIMALFIGSWSDRTGHRKIFIIISIIGQVLINVNGIIHTYFFYELRMEFAVFSEALIEGITGSWCVCILTVFSYISDITNNENRTFRMGLLYFGLTVAIPVSTGISGIFLKSFGYYGCYGFVGSIHLINLTYNTFILKDPKRSPEQKMHDKKGIKHFVRLFFDISNIKNTVQVIFKKGINNRRMRMCIIFLVVSVLFGPMQGEIAVMYISTRYRFNWDEVKFSIFQAYNFISHTVGTIFSILVFSKYLQWHDSVLGIISTVSKIAASFLYCFAPNARIFYIAPLVDILNGTSLLAMRSTASKLVSPDEFGKMNSIFALAENLTPLVYTTLYTRVYVATMEVLPGAVFLIGGAMTLPAVIFFIWLFWEHRMNLRKEKKLNLDELAEKELMKFESIQKVSDLKEL